MDLMVLAQAAMQRDTVKLQLAAQNLSNSLTAGYKKQVVSPGLFAAQFDAARSPSGVPSLLPTTAPQFIDSSAGTLRGTGVPTDLAIEGDGFFELAGPDGAIYTRRGEFRLDSSGRLVTPQGLPVAGSGGDIVLSNEPFQIDVNGAITQAGAVVGRVKLVHFRQTERMEPLGGATYSQGGAILSDVPGQFRVRAGYLENSNVDSAREMVSLTETVRHFEAIQKVVQGYDEVLEKSIRKLGEF